MSEIRSESSILTRIRQLKRELRTPEHVAELIELAAQLRSPDALERAGHLLAYVSWPVDTLREVRIAVLSNFTCNPVLNQLRALLLRSGLQVNFYVSGFNQFRFDLLDESSPLYDFQPTFTLCLLDEHWILDDVGMRFTLEVLESAVGQHIDELASLLERLQQRTGSLVVVNTVPLSTRTYHAVIDYQSKAQLGVVWRDLNTRLLRWATTTPSAYAVDLEVLLQDVESIGLYDAKLSYHAAMHLSAAVIGTYAAESAKIIRAALGLTKKCLVLDLDNTLWGGVVGDVGSNGIDLGSMSPGNIFVDLQEHVLRLQDQGVLLAVCSKNDDAVAREVFEHHDAMRLRLEHLVAFKANWEPKPHNLREIAAELNLGSDSLVLLDDNPVERDMVTQFMPEVAVPDIDGHPATFLHTLLAEGWFNVLELSAEDASRTQKYKETQARDQLYQCATSIEDYLWSLDTVVRVRPLDSTIISRLAQLSLRTNQFNLTTRRYQELDLLQLVESGSYRVFGFEVTDRCGSSGLVSAVVIEEAQESGQAVWYIRSYVLSCRVFSRGVEVGILRYLLGLAQQQGVQAVYGEYVASPKNSRFADFYLENGFTPVPGVDGMFRHDLAQLEEPVPWLRIETANEM